jgi:hypothetical protein
MEELMGEGDLIHNLCRLADKKKNLKTGEFNDITLWILMFNGAFDRKSVTYSSLEAPKLRKFAGRLCKTPPKEIFNRYAWKGHSLISRDNTIVWMVARKFLGGA